MTRRTLLVGLAILGLLAGGTAQATPDNTLTFDVTKGSDSDVTDNHLAVPGTWTLTITQARGNISQMYVAVRKS